MPLMYPSTTWRARISRRPMRRMASGCKNRFESGVIGQFILSGRRGFKQAIDNVVGGNAVALGGEVHDDAVAKHGLGERLNVVNGDVRATVHERPRQIG